mgnify:CR=1 FL=1
MTKVVVLTNERDFAADGVIAHLQRLGATVQRVNIESATSHAVAPWRPHSDPSPAVARVRPGPPIMAM